MTNTPHDTLTKAVFADLRQARAFFRSFLPAPIARQIDFSTLKAEPDTYVDDVLSERRSDRVFSVRMGQKLLLLYLLFEHQSQPDWLMPHRLARVTIRIQDDWLKSHPGARTLPPVLPLVLYHGEAKWSGPLRETDLLEGNPATGALLEPYVVDLKVLMIDLSHFTDAELKARVVKEAAYLTLAMLVMKGRKKPDLLDRLLESVHLIRRLLEEPTGLRALRTLISYLVKAAGESVTATGLKTLVSSAGAPAEAEDLVMNLAEKWQQEGRQEGSRIEARDTLIRLLGVRFGPLDEAIVCRIREANLELLRGWLDRVVTAESASEVLES